MGSQLFSLCRDGTARKRRKFIPLPGGVGSTGRISVGPKFQNFKVVLSNQCDWDRGSCKLMPRKAANGWNGFGNRQRYSIRNTACLLLHHANVKMCTFELSVASLPLLKNNNSLRITEVNLEVKLEEKGEEGGRGRNPLDKGGTDFRHQAPNK